MGDDGAKCIFCGIAHKKINAFVVYEDEHAVGFLDVKPRVEGHTLVVPKFHAATLLELPDGEIGPLFVAVKKLGSLLTRAFSADGLTIGINQGAASGQLVDHLHVHIFPRFKNDGGGSVHSVVRASPKRSLEEVRAALRAALDT